MSRWLVTVRRIGSNDVGIRSNDVGIDGTLMRRLLLLALLASPLNAWSWGPDGHYIVCEMAYSLLDKSARKAVDALVAQLPDEDREALNDFLETPGADIHFADTCVWPDVMKTLNKYEEVRHWHYVNVDRADKQVGADDCLVGCVTSAISHHASILEQQGDDGARLKALMFLGHWLGDIHQPLHVSFADDLGGNEIAVRGYPTGNLHMVWDFGIIKTTGRTKDELSRALLNSIPRNRWARDPVLNWANESLALSRSGSLQYCIGKDVCQPIKPTGNEKTYRLAEDYQKRHWPIASQRLQMAAVRLAAMLKKIF